MEEPFGLTPRLRKIVRIRVYKDDNCVDCEVSAVHSVGLDRSFLAINARRTRMCDDIVNETKKKQCGLSATGVIPVEIPWQVGLRMCNHVVENRFIHRKYINSK